MPVEIVMPQLFDAMTEGDLVVWLVEVGSAVTEGQVIAEIETDKSTVELESPESGILTEIVVGAGAQSVAVGATLALVSRDGEPADTGSSREPEVAVARATAVASDRVERAASDERATPLARRMAAQAGVDLADVNGSGPRGRITRQDIERKLGVSVHSAVAEPPPAPGDAGAAGEPLSRTRKTIAERLTEAKRTIPHFYLSVDCDLERLLTLRAETNHHRPEWRLSVNDFVIKALGRALSAVPGANATFRQERVQRHDRVDLSLAVSTERGLVTPVIHDVNALSVAQISAEARRLADRARAGKLSPEEYSGGSFTLSNLGMYDVDALYAIINAPQTAIVGIGRARERPVVVQGEIEAHRVATVTVSADHRVIDGALGAELLGALKSELENPLALLLPS